MNKHEQLVRQIAEEMAREQWGSTWKYRMDENYPLSNIEMEKSIEKMVRFARIAVRHMADISEVFLHVEFMREGYSMDQICEITRAELINRGLLPEPDLNHATPPEGEPVSKCPHCGASPWHTERGRCEDCGEGEHYYEQNPDGEGGNK